jgi:uncharacterized membrane protein HdeD (DUF308 family)
MVTSASTGQPDARGKTGQAADATASAMDSESQYSAKSEAMSGALAQNWWVVALRGVLAIVFGCLALIFPDITLLSLVLVFSAYMLVDGVLAIVSAVRAARKSERWGLLVLEGIANIATGVVAFLWPGITIFVFTILIAAWSIVSGSLMFASAFRLKERHGRWWLGAAGMLSFMFGFLLILAPLLGAIVLTIWLGAYALVFGGLLLVLAFRLRSRQADKATPAPPAAAAQGA